jgi:Lrp/AsnC family leucine-responsive transcriptional regulator
MPSRRPPALDRIDIAILAGLQREGRATIKDISQKVGLSPRACLERVRRLEASGIIIGYQAVIDIGVLSRPLNVFAEIALESHAKHARLEARLREIEEMVECWEITGAFDYLARFACADLGRYEALTTSLIDDEALGVARIVSHVAMRPVRRFAGYPASLLKPRSE